MLEMRIIPVITTAGVRDHLPRLHQPSTFNLNISRFLRIKSIVDSGYVGFCVSLFTAENSGCNRIPISILL